MSVEAYTWALNLAPVPMDTGSGKKREPKPNSSCAFVLVALANHADPDGTNAFPGVDTIVRYTRLSERTVRTSLDRLEDLGVIKPCDPEVIAARIKRADRRPNGYDLDMTRVREDLTDTQMDKIGRDNPWLRPWIELHRRGATDTIERGATVAPRDVTGCNERTHGVQPTQERGATVAPEPSLEPSKEPSSGDATLIELPADPATTSKATGRRKPETALPEDWKPKQRHQVYALEHGLELASEVMKFRTHAAAVDRRLRDWDAGFAMWLQKAREMTHYASPRRAAVRAVGDQRPEGW